MNAFLFTLITTLFVSTYGQLEPEVVAPCKYLSVQIHCSGLEITDEVLKTVGMKISVRAPKGHFRTLFISSTSITNIEKDVFPELTFENIYIENNKLLVNIDSQAFSQQNSKRLLIRNNPQLSDIRIFELANHLRVYQTVEFDFNAIKEIPENAFRPQILSESHTHIRLNHNKIEKIGANAFKHSPLLIHLSLDNNLLSKIDDNAFNFNDNHLGEIVIDLQHNHLSSQSFTKNSFVIPHNLIVTLGLEHNLMTDLPEEVFKPLIDNGLKLKLEGNKFYCGCAMKWVIVSAHKANIEGLICNNLSKDIHAITENDLKC